MTLLGGDDEATPATTLGRAFEAFAVGMRPLADACANLGYAFPVPDIAFPGVSVQRGGITYGDDTEDERRRYWTDGPGSQPVRWPTGTVDVTITVENNLSPQVVAILTGLDPETRDQQETLL